MRMEQEALWVLPLAAEELARVLELEDRAGRTDPYRRVAALLHLCGVRG